LDLDELLLDPPGAGRLVDGESGESGDGDVREGGMVIEGAGRPFLPIGTWLKVPFA